ncbi:type II toxin-antitoxin system RelE/ParE family toxin [Terriglobus roseus]|uniref:Plasmid stabilization system protein ParE n=1 Tax=Terriglobus roseus TaxID=392734 RepID=A0A1H4MIZ3_9BACT|nr:type II toxin-antitoxin system RelE/ParE family toxin [Terriglobus roseus]SEB82837.1 Plasmid stabilization system protein ParE [Terriglobus roseus]
MAFPIKLTRRAERDLAHIANYVDVQLHLAASDWFVGLTDTILSLRHLPKRGSLVAGKSGRRQLFYGSKPHVYKVIYVVNDAAGKVTILQVRHGARRPIR